MFNLETMKELYQFSSLSAMQQLIAARTINSTMKPKIKDMTTPGRFRQRGIKKMVKIFGMSEDVAGQVYDCMIELSEREGMMAMNGLGGSTVRSMKEILSQYNLL
jgi:hypothetical protein